MFPQLEKTLQLKFQFYNKVMFLSRKTSHIRSREDFGFFSFKKSLLVSNRYITIFKVDLDSKIVFFGMKQLTVKLA